MTTTKIYTATVTRAEPYQVTTEDKSKAEAARNIKKGDRLSVRKLECMTLGVDVDKGDVDRLE